MTKTNPTTTLVASEPEVATFHRVVIAGHAVLIGISTTPEHPAPRLVIYPEDEHLVAVSADLVPLLTAALAQALRYPIAAAGHLPSQAAPTYATPSTSTH